MAARTLTFQVDGMHCAGCALLIDEELEELDGVMSAQTSVRKGTSTVTIDTDRCRSALIVEAIASAGYTARPR